jgi:hypothetical protein
MMIKRPFEQWLFEDVEKEFGIRRTKNHPTLVNWLHTAQSKPLSKSIIRLQTLLDEYIETWNEDELKMVFIAPLLAEINFHYSPHYKVFTQRLFCLQTATVDCSGKIEWLVATGKQTPQKPMFFLHEYKPEKFSGNDPLGQLLIAMVDVQLQEEKTEKTLYGCYTLGRFWFFVILANKEYSVSKAYDATQTNDLTVIVEVLEKVKIYIHQELGLEPPTYNF